MKQIFVINGSAGAKSSNQQLIDNFANLTKEFFSLTIFNGLKMLPHFDPDLSVSDVPKGIAEFRRNIETADGILICTPEYVFSIPSGLKNAIEWCVATTVFSGKPTGLITASSHGAKGHEELQLIMKTIEARFTATTTLLVQGIKSKINSEGQIIDEKTKAELASFIDSFKKLVVTSAV